MAQFDDIRLEAWIERAAIMEYDAGLSREEAERRALLDVLATYGWPHPTDGP
ncbi:hypothetical protein [Vogesella fluminis]|uniref:hypothetical protein n=1 Tax=Vogesella fluminis TaxID=1069161 RepID=UPI001674DDC9|nr:hypothetical protein [Vogesella fluminis]